MTTLTTPEGGREQTKVVDTTQPQNEVLYRAIADSLQCGIWAFDNARRTLYTNAALTEMLGYSAAEFTEKSLEQVLADNDAVHLLALGDDVERRKQFELAIRHKNKQTVWCDTFLSRLRDTDGNSVGFIVHFQNITQPVQTEIPPLNVDKYYLKLLAQFPKSGLMIFDHDLRFHAVHGSFYREGLTPADIEGRLFTELYPKEVTGELSIAMRQALQGELVVLEKQVFDRFHWLIFAPLQAEQGHVTRGMVLVQNITERKLAEIALRENEMFYRAIFETFFDGLIISIDGVIADVNRALEQMTGYEQEELVGQPVDILVPPEWRAVIQERVKNQIISYLEGVTRRKDGSLFPVESQSVIIPYKGQVARLTAIRDITQRLESQRIQIELEKANELRQHKDFFLSMVSHEFRTPLAVIRSSTDILQHHYIRLDAEKRQIHFERVFSQIEKLTNMVEDVLLLSRSEMKGIEFLPQQCDIDLFCQDLLANLTRAYPQTRVEYSIQLPQTSFNIDIYLLEHILWNLLGNGAKYSPADGQISLRLFPSDDGICFEIQDNGIGIPQKELEHIFDPFQRASNVGTIMGTGMGLAIVKRFVELHGGIIECKSEMGVGTIFTVTISAGVIDDDTNSRD